jgi:hypothetical protein
MIIGALFMIAGLVVMLSGLVSLWKSDQESTEKLMLSVLLVVCGFAAFELGIFQVLVSIF